MANGCSCLYIFRVGGDENNRKILRFQTKFISNLKKEEHYMRTSRVVTVDIALVAVFLCWFGTVHAGPSLWPNNKGEICLKNTSNDEVARMAVMRTVGNNYIVHGFVTENLGYKSLFNGNAIVDGNWVLMQVSSSGYKQLEGEVHGFVGRVEIDASTLEGWVLGVGFNCAGNPNDDNCALSYDGQQALVPIPCP